MSEFEEIGISKESVLKARSASFSLQEKSESGALRLHVLAAGSKGNAAIVENALTGEGILIDCGISNKAFKERCQEAQYDLSGLKAVLITHEHGDHTKGLGVVTRGLSKMGIQVPLVTSNAIAHNSREIQSILEANELMGFNEFCSSNWGGISVNHFATSHDSVESFGFRFESNGFVLGYITDSGFVTPEAHEGLVGSNLLALESNHDSTMLKNGPYPYVIKQRIASDKGHLSNEQAALELKSLLHNDLKQVICMHISENNNTYRLPVETLQKVLEENDHSAKVCCTYQNRLVSV